LLPTLANCGKKMILRDAHRSARPLMQTAAGQPTTASGDVRDHAANEEDR